MKFRGAIFDLDGTLLDSMWIWREVDDTYIRSKGKIPAPDLSRQLATKNMAQSVAYFQTAYQINEPADKMTADLWALAEHAYREKAPLKANVYNFLLELNRRGIRMMVATASDKAFTEAALRRLGVLHLFAGVITCDELGKGKDHPDVFFAAQNILGVPKEEIIVFEDSLHAVETAKKAGFTVAAVYDRFASPDVDKIRQAADTYLYSLLDFNFEKELIGT